MFNFSYIIKFFVPIISVLPTTLLLVLVSAVLGVIIGAVIAIIRVEKIPVLRQICAVAVSFFRGTPILIQMFVVYYGLPLLLLGVGIDIMRWDKMLFIYITFGLNVGAFLSEVFRSSILSVPSSQWDAAAMVGHGKARAYLSVIVPQAAVIAIPSLSYTFIMLFQDTSLTFAMGVVDVIGKAQLLGGRIFHTMEGYFVAAIIFITFSILIEKGFALLAKRLNTQGKIFKG